ncbi:unnamed protein product [Meloidogyne enterolobii]|uniref:Uncharacterized protein n=3 Tax=Meloidogyne enterolobii TaxID=390850 RepID=A0ACB1AKW2_MELEN
MLDSFMEVTPCFDYIAIYDGLKATSSLLLPPSCSLPLTDNNELNPNFISSHRQIDVFFSSDSSTELAGTGFQAEFRAIKSDCGGAFLAGQEWSDVSFVSERTLKRTNQRHKRQL